MPEPVGDSWSSYPRAVGAWQDAKAVAAKAAAEAEAEAAPDVDARAARQAVETGKPLPASVVPKATDLADRTARAVDPFERLAQAAERDYLAVVAEHRSEWRDTARPAADSAVAAALTSLDAAQQEADTAAQACRLRLRLARRRSPHSGGSRQERLPTGTVNWLFRSVS